MSTDRFKQAKRGFITRNVDLNRAQQLLERRPSEGDLVLARIERVRQHTRLENIYGRREYIYPGDEVILAAGRRYSTAQFKAELPDQLGAAHLVAAGGIAARVTAKSSRMRPATEIQILGVLADNLHNPLNLLDFAPLEGRPQLSGHIPQLAVVGSDMDAGKTTTACAVINGLSRQGYRVFAAKLTGTGAGPDYWRMYDAGSCEVMDFIDAGWPSTVGRTVSELLWLQQQLAAAAFRAGAQVMVIELADGIFQPETSQLLQHPEFVARIANSMVAADSATAAAMVCQQLIQQGIPVCGISGVVTMSPVAIEEVQQQLGLPVYTSEQLTRPELADYLYATLQHQVEHVAVSVG